MDFKFIYDKRLGIEIPHLYKDWDEYTFSTQTEILLRWEQNRGSIPDRIADLEVQINQKQAALNNEENFPKSCELNSDISELASIINDLWIWYRINQNVTDKVHQ
ncbi:hypothetical protein BTR23_07080 [Alkalihalophilus pseudofirmus]|uniref:hypothetical protein n=1 Tax=Alkalihalobacterium alkalinitrilicum TaxID=427920 RepID=UPI00094BFFBC|nr:hypothetical protein [Alkalihalobacterium alkalinitrilicum]OLO40249.1 hypothetical protein BTR23_07080 [Alkalihalophilus pseudofirmus]